MNVSKEALVKALKAALVRGYLDNDNGFNTNSEFSASVADEMERIGSTQHDGSYDKPLTDEYTLELRKDCAAKNGISI